MNDLVERRAYLSNLFDVYSVLLTDKQCQMFDLYYQDDLSLGEIAEECAVSRQAVFDIIKRTEHSLEEYEDKLQLVAKAKARGVLIKKLMYLAEGIHTESAGREIQELLFDLEDILE